jgi:hypothetical protein
VASAVVIVAAVVVAVACKQSCEAHMSSNPFLKLGDFVFYLDLLSTHSHTPRVHNKKYNRYQEVTGIMLQAVCSIAPSTQ